MTPTDDDIDALLAGHDAEVRRLALEVCALVRDVVPDASEELDTSAKLIGFTFAPGTYKGLFVAVALQRSYVNLMFSRGVELAELDTSGLLAGTGKRARHIKIRGTDQLADPQIRTLVSAAAERTRGAGSD